jgi:hypothetical protein
VAAAGYDVQAGVRNPPGFQGTEAGAPPRLSTFVDSTPGPAMPRTTADLIPISVRSNPGGPCYVVSDRQVLSRVPAVRTDIGVFPQAPRG